MGTKERDELAVQSLPTETVSTGDREGGGSRPSGWGRTEEEGVGPACGGPARTKESEWQVGRRPRPGRELDTHLESSRCQPLHAASCRTAVRGAAPWSWASGISLDSASVKEDWRRPDTWWWRQLAALPGLWAVRPRREDGLPGAAQRGRGRFGGNSLWVEGEVLGLGPVHRCVRPARPEDDEPALSRAAAGRPLRGGTWCPGRWWRAWGTGVSLCSLHGALSARPLGPGHPQWETPTLLLIMAKVTEAHLGGSEVTPRH